MRRMRAVAAAVLALVAVAALAAEQAQPSSQAARPRRIAVFGSSVANGTGDELRKEGYTGRLRELLAPAGWEVFNQSRGGDNTVRMAPRFAPEGTPEPNTKYLLSVNPSYVVLGLSLGNEGLQGAKTQAEKDSIYAQFDKGMRGFIDRSRQQNIVPVVSLCYTRNDSTPLDYEYTRRMNLLINTWDAPSVNFLGGVDDGTGKWAEGFWNDALHPTAAGHVELLTTFVPTLFEALEKGKPKPTRSPAAGFARVSGGQPAPLTFTPAATMHPFAVSVTARAQSDGTIAAISGATLTATTVPAPPGRAGGPPTDRKVTTLSSGGPFTVFLGVQNGAWTYTASNGRVVTSLVKADASWHQVVVSHYTARGETLFFVDGKLAGTVAERLQPARFAIGGPDASAPAAVLPSPKQADYRDLLIYRAALNADEVTALQNGALLQASLEVYAPLADSRFDRGASLENRAQSLAAVRVEAGTVVHADR